MIERCRLEILLSMSSLWKRIVHSTYACTPARLQACVPLPPPPATYNYTPRHLPAPAADTALPDLHASAHLPALAAACTHARLHACTPACLDACTPARLHACMHTHACLPACAPACLRPCTPACLRACVPPCLRAAAPPPRTPSSRHACTTACPACLHACMPLRPSADAADAPLPLPHTSTPSCTPPAWLHAAATARPAAKSPLHFFGLGEALCRAHRHLRLRKPIPSEKKPISLTTCT